VMAQKKKTTTGAMHMSMRMQSMRARAERGCTQAAQSLAEPRGTRTARALPRTLRWYARCSVPNPNACSAGDAWHGPEQQAGRQRGGSDGERAGRGGWRCEH
jgi:hypothetical protein